uniref:(northern house mosquito) hypothetical protein n=1 Tax=Culex pipiens TaxID=7175 RepID=A0A8D8A6K1_CULPI
MRICSRRCSVSLISFHAGSTVAGRPSSQESSQSHKCWYKILILMVTGASHPNGSNNLEESESSCRLVLTLFGLRLTLNENSSSLGCHKIPSALTAFARSSSFTSTGVWSVSAAC